MEETPRILVSACLAGRSCRYDGRSNAVAAVVRLVEEGRAIPVCPEVLGGLPVPRVPCEKRGERVIDRDGVDRTAAFRAGAGKALETALAAGVTRAILKAKSPSCGRGQIYDGTFTGRLVPGDGVFASMLLEHGVEVRTEKDVALFADASDDVK